jgi:hypothetical protein
MFEPFLRCGVMSLHEVDLCNQGFGQREQSGPTFLYRDCQRPFEHGASGLDGS